MYVTNYSTDAVTIFDTVLNPGDSRRFFFSENVVYLEIKKKNRVIYSNKLPNEVFLSITDRNIIVNDDILFFVLD